MVEIVVKIQFQCYLNKLIYFIVVSLLNSSIISFIKTWVFSTFRCSIWLAISRRFIHAWNWVNQSELIIWFATNSNRFTKIAQENEHILFQFTNPYDSNEISSVYTDDCPTITENKIRKLPHIWVSLQWND